MPRMIRLAKSMKRMRRKELFGIVNEFDNSRNIQDSLNHILHGLVK
jgi:phosphopantothenate synthetase